MPIRIAVVTIDVQDTSRVANFWASALGWGALPDPNSGGVSLMPPEAVDESGSAGPSIDVMPVSEAKSVKNRLHLDVRPDGTTQADEVERLLGLGATRTEVGQGADVSWVVLADPEGNEFCVLQRSVQDVQATAASA